MVRHRRRYRSYDTGRERARQHIEDARRLTAELGGMDQDVKAYFFSLPPEELDTILTAYGREFGAVKEDYARETMTIWRNGTRRMSGTVAERLFKLLPPRMPISAKYRLAEGLWHHVGPSSNRTLRIGPDASVDCIVTLAGEHINEVVTAYRVPDGLARRFEWLSAGDVEVKQDLMNHLREMEKSLVVEAARLQMPILLDHLRSASGQRTTRLAQVLSIGKHELELLLDREATGVKLEEASVRQRAGPSASQSDSGWLWWLGLGAVIVIGWILLG